MSESICTDKTLLPSDDMKVSNIVVTHVLYNDRIQNLLLTVNMLCQLIQLCANLIALSCIRSATEVVQRVAAVQLPEIVRSF